MDKIVSLLTTENVTMFFVVLFGISESLAVIPSVKSNSVFQWVFNVLKTLSGKSDKTA